MEIFVSFRFAFLVQNVPFPGQKKKKKTEFAVLVVDPYREEICNRYQCFFLIKYGSFEGKTYQNVIKHHCHQGSH